MLRPCPCGFDATMKDLGRDNSIDFLITFDRPPNGVVSLLNPDLSTVTTAADFVLGVGDPLSEVIHIDFQSGPSAWKHASTLAQLTTLLYSDYHVPVRCASSSSLPPEAICTRISTGKVSYAARPKQLARRISRYEVQCGCGEARGACWPVPWERRFWRCWKRCRRKECSSTAGRSGRGVVAERIDLPHPPARRFTVTSGGNC